MSTELLIVIQAAFAAIVAIVILLLIIRRQKQTIGQLKDILTTVKDEISGENLTGYLQIELDDTTAHCAKDTVALRPDLSAEDMAVSLRFMVLQAELALVQDHVGTKHTPWREKIKNYVNLAEKVLELSKARVDHATKTLTDTHNEELAAKDQSLAALEEEKQDLQKQVDNLKPLVSCLDSAADDDLSRNELELKLHKALLGICENFPNSEALGFRFELCGPNAPAAQLSRKTRSINFVRLPRRLRDCTVCHEIGCACRGEGEIAQQSAL